MSPAKAVEAASFHPEVIAAVRAEKLRKGL
jgi:hypothetical protein